MTPSKAWLPVLLGLAAAAGNYLVISEATATTQLVAVRGDVKPGTPLRPEDLYPVPARGGEPLFRSAITYAQRDSVLGKTVRRKVAGGELLLRADVEYEPYQIDPLLLATGEKSLTLPARMPALTLRPHPGARVELLVRQASGTPAARYGPYTFLGWVAGSPNARDQELVYLAVGVREDDPRVAELRTIRETNAADRLVSVEVVRPPLTLPR